MTTIRLLGQPRSSPAHAVDQKLGQRHWSVSISWEGEHQDVQIVSPATSDDEQLLQWYLEDFAIQDPFDNLRASTSLKLIQDYGHQLVKSLDLSSLLPTEHLQDHIVFEIQELGEQQPSIHGIHWEILESLDIWPSPAPKSVCIIRLGHGTGQTLPIDPGAALRDGEHTLDIVVVSARPQGTNDIPHRIVSRQILDVIRKLPDDKAPNVRMHVVRPGTVAALESHLSQLDKKGHVNLVHFDLHGEADKENGRFVSQNWIPCAEC